MNRRAVGYWILLLLTVAASSAHGQEAQRGRIRSPHGSLAVACQNCHTASSWKPLRSAPDFSHQETRFPLRGMHESVACRSCHVQLVFTEVGVRCAECHADLHRGQFSGKCDACHTVRGWRVDSQSIRDHQNRFPLIGAHSAVECQACHKQAAASRFQGLASDCASCHLKDYQQTAELNHQAAQLPRNCELCHSLDTWREARFDHARFARFELVGAHSRLACTACHVGGRFVGTAADCFSCHAREYAAAKEPDHVHAGFPQTCQVCHSMATWKGAIFDHNATTRFPLTGAHVGATCSQCHIGGQFAGTATDCYACHVKNYERTRNPDHLKLRIPTQCISCHTTERWPGARFDHTLTRFPLSGAHSAQECTRCHAGGQYGNASSTCVSCHLADFNNSRNPNHAAVGFPKDCVLCHTSTQWKGARFDHNTATRFQLVGAHVNLSCTQCHAGGVFQGLPSSCVACHLAGFNTTRDPNHRSAGFSENCTVCHNTTQWKGAQFDHAKTRFQLTGAHVSVVCRQCHINDRYAGLPSSCVACHLRIFNATKDPNHITAGFPRDCQVCHNTAQWKGARFDHNTATRFPLVGAHVNLGCIQCHAGGVFQGLPSSCVACHLADFNTTRDPNHRSAGFSENCVVCHNATQWKGAQFDHAKTRFQLTGAHVSVVCGQCHVNDRYAGLPGSCVSCHLSIYNATKDPNHITAGFPQDCQVCHNTAQWKGAKFDHNTATRFQLSGAHTTLGCQQCHLNGRYAGLPSSCVSCHLANYNNSKNPNHIAAGFPQDCALCHGSSQWTGARFDHNTATRFPLTGAHITVVCRQCHANDQFKGLPSSCVSCHLANYNRSTNPNHIAAGFPQDCTLCHSTTRWPGATFNHGTTRFPLTGAHTSAACSGCHANNRFSGTPTTCVSCHLAKFNSSTNPNHAAAGFPQDCVLCHSTTRWQGATFNHGSTRFPLTGAHITVVCANCHVGNRFTGTPADCYSCHQTVYNSTTNPNHRSAGFPTTCASCHNTTRWQGATFNHKFPITSGKHRGRQCTECHLNPSNYAVFSCTNCHQHDKTPMDQKHRGVRNYTYNSVNCYACHPQGRAG